MGEPFDAIGFKISEEASYQALAEEAHLRGVMTRGKRERGMLHGCCWDLGSGVEVWTMLYETKAEVFYANCRPAYRSSHLFSLYPWEIVEYEEEGEAITRGTILGRDHEVVFELQNITEINPVDYRDRAVTATVSGLAYRAQINAKPGKPTFRQLEKIYSRRKVLETDYAVRGKILSWREIKNPQTAMNLIVFDIDAGAVKLEVIVNRATLKGEPKRGGWLSSEVWLQGYLLTDKDLRSRYEGVDLETPQDVIWQKLRREN